jgi:hypothetical protein
LPGAREVKATAPQHVPHQQNLAAHPPIAPIPNAVTVFRLTLRTEAVEECLMRISEQAAKQIAKVISEFNCTRDFLFAEEQAAASATLQ